MPIDTYDINDNKDLLQWLHRNFDSSLHDGPVLGRESEDTPYMHITQASYDSWVKELWDAYVEDIVSTVCKLKTEGSLPEKDKHAPECPPKVDVPSCETCAYCYEQTTDNGARNFVCGRIENGEPAEYMYLDGEATVLRGQAYMALSSTDNDQRAHTCCGYYKQETRTETY